MLLWRQAERESPHTDLGCRLGDCCNVILYISYLSVYRRLLVQRITSEKVIGGGRMPLPGLVGICCPSFGSSPAPPSNSISINQSCVAFSLFPLPFSLFIPPSRRLSRSFSSKAPWTSYSGHCHTFRNQKPLQDVGPSVSTFPTFHHTPPPLPSTMGALHLPALFEISFRSKDMMKRRIDRNRLLTLERDWPASMSVHPRVPNPVVILASLVWPSWART
jgi:hypothetical protein